MKYALCVGIFLSLWPVAICRAAPELAGVLTSGGKTFLALRAAEGKPSTWHQVGEQFGEYLVASFDPSVDAVTLTNGGAQTVIRLKGAKVDPKPTVELVEQLARDGDMELRRLLPELKILENRRATTAADLADLQLRSASDPNAAKRVEEVRRKLRIEEDSIGFFLSRVVRSPPK